MNKSLNISVFCETENNHYELLKPKFGTPRPMWMNDFYMDHKRNTASGYGMD
jgi:hypothetical protein